MGFFSIEELEGGEVLHSLLPLCGKCGLHKGCFSPRMEPSGTGEKKILFIGEAPGEEEDKQGCPFVGPSGQLLRDLLSEIPIDMDECSVTNAVICHPPKNKLSPKVLGYCRPNLLRTIDDLKPNVIIPLGMTATSALLADEWKKDVGAISRWVGWKIPFHTYSAWVCPTYHPSYLLRQRHGGREDPTLRKIMVDHLSEAVLKKKVSLPTDTLDRLKAQVEVIDKPKQAYLRLKDLSRKKGYLSFDYETTGVKPDRRGHEIVTAAFCLDGEDTFSVLLHPRHHKVLSKILQSKRLRKVAHNLKFEQRWTHAILGHDVTPWYRDTMLDAHRLDNRPGVTSLKFQAFVRLGIPDYSSHIAPYLRSSTRDGFNRIREAPIEPLLMYNGLDSLLGYKILIHQQKERSA